MSDRLDSEIEFSDLALDLADICSSFNAEGNIRGDDFLAKQFGTRVWSNEFMEILSEIRKRIARLEHLVNQLDLDAQIASDLKGACSSIARAFEVQALHTTWNTGGGGSQLLGRENWRVIRQASTSLRKINRYPRLSEQEVLEAVEETKTLLKWCVEHQIEQFDYLREAIIIGLRKFEFRLQHYRWLGWEYSLEPLKEIHHAYDWMGRKEVSPNDYPSYAAMNKLVGEFLAKKYGQILKIKNVADTGVWAFTVYQAVRYLSHNNNPQLPP